MSEGAQPTPPWGALPVEQYLLLNWDASSALSTADQTRKLVRAFLDLDEIPRDWDATRRGQPGENDKVLLREPTEEEVRTILQPWRPLRWRTAAHDLWTKRSDQAIWLRTHYGPGSDEKFRAWRETNEYNDPRPNRENCSWVWLDDADVFDVGDEWWRVFDVLPELAGPLQGFSRRPDHGIGEESVQPVREELHQEIERRTAEGEDPAEVAVYEAERGEYGQELQVMCVETFLYVADARAWETGCVRMMFLDSKSNLIRHTTMEAEEAYDARFFFFGAKFIEGGKWGYIDDPEGAPGYPGAVLGDKYRAYGEQGRMLYGLSPA